jgi:hypothetical protein
MDIVEEELEDDSNRNNLVLLNIESNKDNNSITTPI